MTVLGSFASLFFKNASGSKSITKTLCNKFLYLGIALYVLAAILNVMILKYLDYSVVLPLTSVTYVWTMLISFFILKEKLSFKKILGVLFILSGAIIVAL